MPYTVLRCVSALCGSALPGVVYLVSYFSLLSVPAANSNVMVAWDMVSLVSEETCEFKHHTTSVLWLTLCLVWN